MIDERELLNQVIAKSKEIPVLVDFWAEWCQPCKALTPILEKLAAEANGAWELVKINVDECRTLAAQFGIQGIPNCKLLYEGRLIGEFSGAQAEGEVRAWLDEYIPKQPVPEIEVARQMVAELELDKARSLLERLIAQDPQSREAQILLAQTLIFNFTPKAQEILNQVGEDSEFFDKAKSLRFLAELLGTEEESLPESPVRQYYHQALEALRAQRFEETLEAFFEVLIRDRDYQEEGSRRGFIAIFEFLGRQHPISKKYMRRFEMVVFS